MLTGFTLSELPEIGKNRCASMLFNRLPVRKMGRRGMSPARIDQQTHYLVGSHIFPDILSTIYLTFNSFGN
jgi:hypothetical protein